MPNTFTFNDVEYNLDTISEEAKTLVGQLQEISNHSAYLQSQLGIAQIAHTALADSLGKALPTA